MVCYSFSVREGKKRKEFIMMVRFNFVFGDKTTSTKSITSENADLKIRELTELTEDHGKVKQ